MWWLELVTKVKIICLKVSCQSAIREVCVAPAPAFRILKKTPGQGLLGLEKERFENDDREFKKYKLSSNTTEFQYMHSQF